MIVEADSEQEARYDAQTDFHYNIDSLDPTITVTEELEDTELKDD